MDGTIQDNEVVLVIKNMMIAKGFVPTEVLAIVKVIFVMLLGPSINII